MSRGPGRLQVEIMETLATYHRLGPDLGWEWNPGGSFNRLNLVTDAKIELYERGRYVEIWMIRRDTGASRDRVSRALRGLDRMGFVVLLGADLEVIGTWLKNAKFAALTRDGEDWLSANKLNGNNPTKSAGRVVP